MAFLFLLYNFLTHNTLRVFFLLINAFFYFPEAESISSKNGKSKLLKYQSFTYSFKYMTRQLMHWRCSTHHAKGCPGGITTFNNSNKVVTIKGEHNHTLTHFKLRVRSKTKKKANKIIFVESAAIQSSD